MTTSSSSATTTTTVTASDIINLLFVREPLLVSSDTATATSTNTYNYGTAGFRFKATVMDGLMVRVGILSIMLLLQQQQQQQNQRQPMEEQEQDQRHSTSTTSTSASISTGVMITASHNDESYNGVKLANPDGSMLQPQQEEFLTTWVNETEEHKWKTLLQEYNGVSKSKSKSASASTNNHNTDDDVTTTHTRSNTSAASSCMLHIGRDTRSHSQKLSNLLIEGAQLFIDYYTSTRSIPTTSSSSSTSSSMISIQDHAVLTTPMLHHIVLHSNPDPFLPSYIEPQPTRRGYLQTYANAYVDLVQDLAVVVGASSPQREREQQVQVRVDSACGVGYHAVQELNEEIHNVVTTTTTPRTSFSSSSFSSFNAENGPGDGPLNDQCGSDHVKTLFQPPIWWKKNRKKSTHDDDHVDVDDHDEDEDEYEYPYCCSLDGDADRIIFFGQHSKRELTHFLDGDKIAILIAHVLQQKMRTLVPTTTNHPTMTMGMVQTAYANGAATKYVQEVLQLPVLITKTGVKHLHQAAVTNFDIGIYFEANGHGTVVFSKQYEHFAVQQQQQSDAFFVKLHRLINPAVGDALCDMLLVDYLLRSLAAGNNEKETEKTETEDSSSPANSSNATTLSSSSSSSSSSPWTLQDWNTKLYTDLPNRMLKVQVQDRSMIQCNDNESICVQPSTVQPKLRQACCSTGIPSHSQSSSSSTTSTSTTTTTRQPQQHMENENGRRCFIRPSGTEDIVRIYAEANTRQDAEELAILAAQIVYDECKGIGERPVL